MPRKAFVADLQKAIKDFERVNVSRMKAGEEDGMINFHYHISDGDATDITVMVPGKWPRHVILVSIAENVSKRCNRVYLHYVIH